MAAESPSLAPTFQDLLPERLDRALSRIGRVVRYGDDEMIQSRGDADPGVSLIRAGAVKGGVYGSDGRYLLTSILWPGETFGEFTVFAGLPRALDMYALGRTEVLEVPGRAFERLFAAEPALARALLEATMVRTHLLLDLLDTMRRLPLLERTAQLLLALQRGGASSALLRYTQADIAFSIGASRVSINRALQQLADAGLVVVGYRSVTIPDLARLGRWLEQRPCMAARALVRR